MAYWGGAGMNYVGGATAKDRKEFLETYDAWLRDNGRVARNVKGVYVPRAYVPKPPRVYKTGKNKGQPIVRKVLTPAEKEARLNNLILARAAKASGIIKPKRVKSTEKRTLSRAQKEALALGRQVAMDRAAFGEVRAPRTTYKAARKPTDVLKSRKTPAQKAATAYVNRLKRDAKMFGPGFSISQY